MTIMYYVTSSNSKVSPLSLPQRYNYGDQADLKFETERTSKNKKIFPNIRACVLSLPGKSLPGCYIVGTIQVIYTRNLRIRFA